MPYDPILVQPMREELTSIGVQELRTGADVDEFMQGKTGTTMIVINSVCGCAAGQARPGVRLALQSDVKPDRVATVFAGQDVEATATLRGYFSQLPPSSPSLALFKDGQVVHFVPRHAIEGRDALSVANDLVAAFNKYCAKSTA
ncbi:MAG: BrxA/BrxB family bacilliredoxin [Candidatus Latescibacterota bacterium]|nr:MAG: BrxA/BrxB family bacilliredoxin [Candidatus Latescibacterota bacterium]